MGYRGTPRDFCGIFTTTSHVAICCKNVLCGFKGVPWYVNSKSHGIPCYTTARGVATALMRAEHSSELFTAANIVSRKSRTPTPVLHLSTQSADSAPASWGGEGVSVALHTSAFTPATTAATAATTGPSNGEDVVIDIEAGAVSANVPANAEADTAGGGGGDDDGHIRSIGGGRNDASASTTTPTSWPHLWQRATSAIKAIWGWVMRFAFS